MRRWYLSISGGGLLSKVLGVLREMLLARFFGTGPVADAYRASLTATLSPVHLLTSRVVQSSFIPLYASYRETRPDRARALFLLVLVLFAALGLLLGLLLFAFAGPLIGFLLPGFDPERRELAMLMLRIMALGVPFYIYSSLLGFLGAAQEDFIIPSLRPGLQNLSMLIMIAIAGLTRQPVLAAYGFAGGYIVLALLGTWLLWRRNEFPGPIAMDAVLLKDTGLALWRLSRPLVIVSVMAEAYILGERVLASLVGGGALASMEYARFLTETSHTLLVFPLGLIGLSHFAKLHPDELWRKVDHNLAWIFLTLVPLSAFLCLNGEPLLRLLYLRGRFDLDSLAMTWDALRGLSLGLWALSASFLLQRTFNARLQNMIVLRGEGLFTALSLLCMIALYRPLGVFGLGLGTSLGALCSLLYYLHRVGKRIRLAGRCFLTLLTTLPVYLLLAWLLGRILAGWSGFLAQMLLAALLWGLVIIGRRDMRELLLNPLGKN